MNRRQFITSLSGSLAVAMASPLSALENLLTLRGPAPWLLVDGGAQQMHFIEDGTIQQSYVISTGKTGFGNTSGSGKTPTGLHRISDKFGENAPHGTIFKGRQNTGRIAEIYTGAYDTPDDHVTSRILWLDGCEPNNRNTRGRYIYIHGTPEEGLLGTPVSHGCIRMRNDEVIALYDLVTVGTYVDIRE